MTIIITKLLKMKDQDVIGLPIRPPSNRDKRTWMFGNVHRAMYIGPRAMYMASNNEQTHTVKKAF